jgi:hypothetical protein
VVVGNNGLFGTRLENRFILGPPLYNDWSAIPIVTGSKITDGICAASQCIQRPQTPDYGQQLLDHCSMTYERVAQANAYYGLSMQVPDTPATVPSEQQQIDFPCRTA